MPRPTKSQIDAEIIDRAAGLFARHGFENTSLQQIADAVNYSKAGLLHHYPSKKAIYDASFKTGRDHLLALLASVAELPPGAERDRAVVEDSVDYTFDWPGVSALASQLANNAGTEENVDPQLTELGLIVYQALGTDLMTATAERIVRITSAFSGLGITALLAARMGLKQEWRGEIIASAMDALGHKKSSSRKRAGPR
ncbi:TetR/AcrR family transcriptional regulator [Variovorax sp. PAMC26660]|uniref:TetR/AcrR family transcriptional regulator n=1 Tax=Variovorax sp. PAMC26660 TaxID=2762322 RepID=UPI00164D3211|nr:TetR/AcrR family transcriptional regulator [Variovorax sp. PAMC26660]QNK65849.1 TetR/AcrR family transcriptional regulator [Variovorax sp. PAMC26660]